MYCLIIKVMADYDWCKNLKIFFYLREGCERGEFIIICLLGPWFFIYFYSFDVRMTNSFSLALELAWLTCQMLNVKYMHVISFFLYKEKFSWIWFWWHIREGGFNQ
jgi:hypothetical protein